MDEEIQELVNLAQQMAGSHAQKLGEEIRQRLREIIAPIIQQLPEANRDPLQQRVLAAILDYLVRCSSRINDYAASRNENAAHDLFVHVQRMNRVVGCVSPRVPSHEREGIIAQIGEIVLQHSHQLEAGAIGSVAAWIYQITMRRIYDYYRSQKRSKVEAFPWEDFDAEIPDEQGDQRQAEMHELFEAFRCVLSEEQQEQRYWDGKVRGESDREIRDALGISRYLFGKLAKRVERLFCQFLKNRDLDPREYGVDAALTCDGLFPEEEDEK